MEQASSSIAANAMGNASWSDPGLAEWTGHPDEEFVWFNYRRGNIVVADPDETNASKDARDRAQAEGQRAR